MSATARLLPGNRLYLSHGPIDLVIGADGEAAAVKAAYVAATKVFPEILPALVKELPFLRSRVAKNALSPAVSGGAMVYDFPPLCGEGSGVGDRHEMLSPDMHPTPGPSPSRGGENSEAIGGDEGTIARAMYAAVWPYRDCFVTPMAAVAGSVADHVLGIMLQAAPLTRAYVNNGGDIALHLAPGASFTVGLVGDLAAPALDARILIRHGAGIGGIATSGWRGRSQSLGIADAVTVLARDAATADAAATMIANAVDVDDPAITRRPAREVKDDSDLGDLLVTVGVGKLDPTARSEALAAGERRAREIVIHGLIIAACIQLQGEIVVVGGPDLVSRAA